MNGVYRGMTRMVAVLALLCTTVVLAACGGDDSSEKPAATSSSSGAGQQLEVTAAEPAEDKYAFEPGSLTAKAGAVTISMDNPSSDKAAHSVAIEGNGVDESSQVVPPGKSATVSADLETGTYTFYCTVGDHREDGMEGKLTVD